MLYSVVRAVLFGILRPYTRLTFEGQERLPASGPFVLAPVHRSFADFALVAFATKRRLRFMAKDSLWNNKILGRFLDTVGAFPVHRGTVDRQTLRTSIAVLEGGEPLVIFPEGTRRSGAVVDNLFEGAAHVAARAHVPIVPVGIGGSERMMKKGKKLPRPTKVHIVIGEPIAPPEAEGRTSRSAVHDITTRLVKEMQTLFDAAQV
jgi:1-acyl-sn-glycerol-3-phosphate acyltransferase